MKLSRIFVSALMALVATAASAGDYDRLYEGLPFEMPVVNKPVFPNVTVSLADFAVEGGASVLQTEAFSKAIEALSAKGGGTLNVPSGVWFTGPIELKSNINLHLEHGAVITFTPDVDQYELRHVTYEGHKMWRVQSPITGENLVNVAITGEGVIDGNGGTWRYVKKSKMAPSEWDRLVKNGGVVVSDNLWFPSEQNMKGHENGNRLEQLTREEAEAIKPYLRPVMIQLVSCKNVLLEGVTFQNSPAWNVHPLLCENLIVDNVNIRNPYFAQNGDGLDVESCRNVIIYRSTLDVGDDAICMKSGKDEAGRKRGVPTENVIVRDCRVYHGHGGFVVGSEMSGGVNNVSVRDCEFIGTDIGLRFKSTRGRGGVVSNIYIDNINMIDILNEALSFDLYYFAKNAPKTVPPVDETTPRFCDIFITNVTSLRSGTAIKFNGIPEMPIDKIRVSDSYFTARNGGYLAESENIEFNKVTIVSDKAPAMFVKNVSDCLFRNCSFTVTGSGTMDIKYEGSNKNVKVE